MGEPSDEQQVEIILSEWLAGFDERTEVGRVARSVLPQLKQLGQLRSELAEAREALTAARAEVVRLRETTTYYRNMLGIKADSPTDVHVRPGPYGVSVERVCHHKGCPARVTSECECLPLRTSDLLTRKESTGG